MSMPCIKATRADTFFLLHDLVDESVGSIRFWLPFSDFSKNHPVPVDLGEYLEYRRNVLEFSKARGKRMVEYVAGLRNSR